MKYKKSLLVSNILDPLTYENEELQEVYTKLGSQDNYEGIETRLIHNNETRVIFNNVAEESNWDVVLWLTGDMGRMSLNLSSLDNNLLEKSLKKTYELIDLASKHYCQRVGVGSGRIEDVEKQTLQVERFVESLVNIMNYIDSKGYKLDVIVEPLDQFAHKKNVIGTLKTCQQMLSLLKDNQWLQERRLTFCWDSAHVALNQDDFENSLEILSPYISRIHFADAILKINNEEYGDNHREFDTYGIMNTITAKNIITTFNKFESEIYNIYVACEVRTKNKKDAWKNEKKYFNFLIDVLEGY